MKSQSCLKMERNTITDGQKMIQI